ncbi:MAG: GntR family transcriptional regulator [Candidatus Solibacter sp.]
MINPVATNGPKYQQICQSIKTLIESGTYAPGGRLPSECDFVQSYGASRVTVSRALKELQIGGYIDRRAGSGTYVRASSTRHHTFGLLIPELGQTEIFEPICQGMAEAQQDQNHVLVWGRSLSGSDVTVPDARTVCSRLLANKVSGVFFAPVEGTPLKAEINQAVVSMMSEARVPIVFLDRDIVDYPDRSRFDVVGIDNRRAGCVVTQHLISVGCRRIAFIGRPHLAPSCVARSAGYRDALASAQSELGPAVVERLDPSDRQLVLEVMERHTPDGIVCSNDRTAALLMRTLFELKISIPDTVKIVAFDDVSYASLMTVPLTTIRQPCDQVGAAAIQAMVQRIATPDMPARDILVDFRLIVRESSQQLT